ncbi:MAG TPA: CPBP family intramembrane glutamic endopeptidase [Acidimicrobiales bacterium]|nr:CPBP family intramembrane glutamic endopeptidase [Acidimicrobiales bacterium]
MSITLPLLAPPRRPWSPVSALPWAPAVVGVTALLARPWFLPAGVQVEWRVAFFVMLGLVGVAWPLTRRPDSRPAAVSVSLGVLAIGAAGFALGRALVDVPPGPSALATAIALNALAAVAEEAFFRRYLYGLLDARWGTGAAVVTTAMLFALVHVTVWGWWVLPLDLAAGLLLSWQRAATGRWSVPAATHVLANTLALL